MGASKGFKFRVEISNKHDIIREVVYGLEKRRVRISIRAVRDCSLFIGSTGPVFWGMGQGLFLILPSRGHKDFLCFYGTGHELF